MPSYQVRTYTVNPFFDSFQNTNEPLIENISLDLSVYDQNGAPVQIINDIPQTYWSIDENVLSYNIYDLLVNNGIYNGTYNVSCSLYNNIFGDDIHSLYISDISTSRKEIRVVPQDNVAVENIIHFSSLSKLDENGNELELFVNHQPDNTQYLIVNILNEYRPTTLPTYSFILKLDNPIPRSVSVNDLVNIVIPLNKSDVFNVSIIPTNIEQTVNILASPDYSIKVNSSSGQQTAYQSFTSLTSGSDSVNTSLLGKLLSSGSFGIDLNIDFRDFSNFIFYSSAESRLNAFKFKLTNIQELEGSINSLYSLVTPVSSSITGSVSFQTNIQNYKDQKNQIIQSFDYYETYLYNVSSSYETSSYGEFDPMSWPKYTSGSFYIPYSVTSSLAQDWYDGIITSASFYDKMNEDALYKMIPDHILEDDYSSDFVIFVNAIGHFFDNIWIYIKAQENNTVQDESLYAGMPKDLIYNYLKSLGWGSIDAYQFDDLSYYTLGTDQLGNPYPTGSLSLNETLPKDKYKLNDVKNDKDLFCIKNLNKKNGKS